MIYLILPLFTHGQKWKRMGQHLSLFPEWYNCLARKSKGIIENISVIPNKRVKIGKWVQNRY